MTDEELIKLRDELEAKDCDNVYRNILFIQDTLDVIAGKWKLPILFGMLNGKHKFNDLKIFCKGISDKILNEKLHELIEYKMIEKTDKGYEMTAHGMSLHSVVQSLWEWGQLHRAVMTR